MSRRPAFQFYAKDWRDAKVRGLPLDAQGAYIAILADMWADSQDQCSVIYDVSRIARCLGVSRRTSARILAQIQITVCAKVGAKLDAVGGRAAVHGLADGVWGSNIAGHIALVLGAEEELLP
jgi:hypothetical protein